VPELPEVQALAESLDRRLRGRRIAGLTIASVAALKTYDPPVTALAGRTVAGVGRHGKFLDLEADEAGAGGAEPSSLHLVAHLSRGGWVRWRAGSASTTAPASTSPSRAPRRGSPSTWSATPPTSPG
jgi:formamidopyrimidine-DNA glycosylase